MNPARFKEAYQRLESLDERMTYKVRPRDGGAMTRPSSEQLEKQVRELASYTIELKEILRELFLAIGSKAEKPDA